ncbi:unnamed protein product, partial [Didymodactylos carnosus]
MEAMEIESVHVDSEELTSADLYHACESNNIEQVMRYIESANINDIINKKLHPSGSTALHIAARKGHNEIVKLLLKNNAFRSTTNNYGLTPIEEARTEETRDLFRRINTRHSFMGNLDDAVIEWVTADSDLVKKILDEQEVLITPFAAFNVTNVKRHDSSTNSSVLVEIELEEYEYELDLPRAFYDTLALKLPQGVIKDEDQLGRKINNDYSIVCYGIHVSLSTISTLPDVIYIDDDDECKCIAQINLINNKKVCLMITLNFSEYVIPLIHEQQHIQFIYIYQDYQDKFEKNQKWMKSYRKIRGLFIIKDDLITALNKDIEP